MRDERLGMGRRWDEWSPRAETDETSDLPISDLFTLTFFNFNWTGSEWFNFFYNTLTRIFMIFFTFTKTLDIKSYMWRGSWGLVIPG